jgi:SAM-dependent methyltransferase
VTDRAFAVSDSARLDRERIFHDELAADLEPAAMPPEPLGELESAMFAQAGITTGTRVLDLGCGSGDLTLSLLEHGAQVTGIDLSPGMVDVARRRVAIFAGGRDARLLAAPVEDTGLESDAFDVIVGRFILHHLDIDDAAPEIARVLRSGGRAVFAENSARNRALMAARTHVAGRFGVPRLGTADEYPLSDADLDPLRAHFAGVEVTHPVFEFLRIFDRQVLRFRFETASRVCRRLDRAAGRSRALRPYSFRMLVTLTKPRAAAHPPSSPRPGT